MRWKGLYASIMAASLICATAGAESASTLLEKGIYYEETAGDLSAAIQTYQQVVADAQANRKYAAEAQYRLGTCLLKTGQNDAAVAALRKVAELYPDQRTLVQQASEQIRKARGGSADERVSVERLPAEVMNYIVAEELKSYGQAVQQGLHVNCHIYGVDAALNLYHGGLLAYRNDTDQPQSGPIHLGNFSFKDGFVLVDENGREQNCQFDENPASGGGRYRLQWYPDQPVGSGVSRLLGYVYSPKPLSRTNGHAQLTMQNYFGAAVLEGFFLVTPRGMKIDEESEPQTSSTTIGDFDIRLWQKQVPADTNHLVTARLQALATATTQKAAAATPAPVIVATVPPQMANDVDSALSKLRVTFDQPMLDGCWAWCTYYPDLKPEITEHPSYDESRRTCTVSAKLKPGHLYLLCLNGVTPKYQTFMNAKHVPSQPYLLLFSTRSADGKPMPLPPDLVAQVKHFNAEPGGPLPKYTSNILSNYAGKE